MQPTPSPTPGPSWIDTEAASPPHSDPLIPDERPAKCPAMAVAPTVDEGSVAPSADLRPAHTPAPKQSWADIAAMDLELLAPSPNPSPICPPVMPYAFQEWSADNPSPLHAHLQGGTGSHTTRTVHVACHPSGRAYDTKARVLPSQAVRLLNDRSRITVDLAADDLANVGTVFPEC